MYPTKFILNPRAGGFSGLEKRIKDVVAHSKGSEILYSKLTEHGEVKIDGFKLDLRPSAILGGDGTQSSVINFIKKAYEEAGSECPAFFPMPCGTGNGIKVGLGLRQEPARLLEMYASERMQAREIDLIEMVEHDQSKNVVNIFDAGFVPDVLKTRNAIMLEHPADPAYNRKMFVLQYTWAALRVLQSNTSYNFSRIELDGKQQNNKNVKLITLGNGLCYSSKPGMYPLVLAMIDDGKISSAILRIGNNPLTFWGKAVVSGVLMALRIPNPATKYRDCEEVLFEGKDIPCEVDGEYIGRRDSLYFRIKKAKEKKGIKVYVPA